MVYRRGGGMFGLLALMLFFTIFFSFGWSWWWLLMLFWVLPWAFSGGRGYARYDYGYDDPRKRKEYDEGYPTEKPKREYVQTPDGDYLEVIEAGNNDPIYRV